MIRLAAITLVLALAATGAHARQAAAATSSMTDAKSNAAADTRADGMPSASKAPVCKTGKPCGKSCIAKDKVCHKQ